MINTKAYKKLQQHFEKLKDIRISDLFINDRVLPFTHSLNELTVDMSKNLFTEETLELFLELAEEINLKNSIAKMFNAEKINFTENRCVLHTALRNTNLTSLMIDNNDILPEINASKLKFDKFVKAINEGGIRGSTNKKFSTIVNIGIGGSYLGTQMAYNALSELVSNDIKLYFISNIDGANLVDVLKEIDIETTLFIIASKTFTTLETITNANTIKEMFMNTMGENFVYKHFAALSTNINEVKKFGINPDWIFGFWDFIGGRYSIWSAIGLPLALKIGVKEFNNFLEGAELMDRHLQSAELRDNIPFLLAIIGIWYNNFFNYQSYAILAYDYRLRDFTRYIQQLEMESNGKHIDKDGNSVAYNTSPVVFGEPGTDSQHSFFQMIHQGTNVVPCDFIGVVNPNHNYKNHQDYLLSNLLAQAEALMVGKGIDTVRAELVAQKMSEEDIKKLSPHKVFEGNRPSNVLLLDSLNAKNLGMLCALYEHKIFIQGLFWQINSFDQWGVELGKQLSGDIYNEIINKGDGKKSLSTMNLIKLYKKKSIL